MRSSSADSNHREEMRVKMKNTNHYDVLEIGRDSTSDQIKRAYRRLALRYHPDKNPDPLAKEVFKKISDSYTTLLDKDKRAVFDKTRAAPNQHRPNQQFKKTSYSRPNDQFFQANTNSRFWAGMNGPTSNSNRSAFERKRSEDDFAESMKREWQRQRQEQAEFLRRKRAKENEKNGAATAEMQDILNKLFEKVQNMKKEQVQKKAREQTYKKEVQQPRRYNQQLNVIPLVGFMVLAFMLLSSFSPRRLFSSKPVTKQNYSFVATSVFTERMQTPLLKAPFYVRVQADANPVSKQTEQQIDKEYLTRIRANCANTITQKLRFKRLAEQSQGELRRIYEAKADELSEAACVRMSHLKKKHPHYISSLHIE